MILRIPSLIITQSRKYAIKQIRRQPKKLKGAVIKQPQQNNDDFEHQKQKHAIKTSEEYQQDPEGFGDLESDFMEAHKSHKQFETEAEQHREQVKRWIIRNKYFNEKQPNFLTYAEKQQIKLLHSKDPEEWSTEKLSESFPADPITISKIIKSKWSANSVDRIRKHDELVMRNWSFFREGKLEVQDYLKEHLQKFADRNFDDLKNREIDSSVAPPLPTPTITEFASIITSCKGYKSKQNLIQSGENEVIKKDTPQHVSPAQENETFLMGKVVNRRKMRLQDFKRQSKSALSDDLEILHPENIRRTDHFNPKTFDSSSISSAALEEDETIDGMKLRYKNFKENSKNPFMKESQISSSEDSNKEGTLLKEIVSSSLTNPASKEDETHFHGNIVDQTNNPFKKGLPEILPENPGGTGIIPRKVDNEPTELVISQEDMKKYEVSTVKEQICIPRKLWKRGATYKVEDCYYDSDGEFLYRVPGMTGRSK